MNILVINPGSTTLKYKFFYNEDCVLDGIFQKYSEDNCKWKDYKKNTEISISSDDYENSFSIIKQILSQYELDAIGFRVVHGADLFIQPTLLNQEIIDEIEELNILAPLHNPPAIEKIRQSIEVFPDIDKYAVFDTEFHATLPEKAYLYALPYEFYEKYGIRKYGFHGISHEYLTNEVLSILHNPKESNIITCHLGGGASISAIKDGKCIDTSMGFTPLEGLVMATRAGDVDDGVQNYIEEVLGYSEEEVNYIFNKKSGVLGVSGVSENMVKLIEMYKNGDDRAIRAIDLYIYRIQKYIGSYYSILGNLDALVFSGGVGSGSDFIRKKVCEGLSHFGIVVDDSINDGKINVEDVIEIGKGDVRIFAIPTNEELMIARKIRFKHSR